MFGISKTSKTSKISKIFTIFLFACNIISTSSADDAFLRDKILNNVRNSGNMRPYANTSKPVIIEPQINVIHLYGVNYEDQTYTITGYFRQTWYDNRLQYNKNETNSEYLLFTKNDGIWIPDSFFSNSISHKDRSSNGFDNNRAYHYLRVWPDGKVLYSQMIDLKLNAFLELKYYPYHITLPMIVLESYSYSTKDLKYILPLFLTLFRILSRRKASSADDVDIILQAKRNIVNIFDIFDVFDVFDIPNIFLFILFY